MAKSRIDIKALPLTVKGPGADATRRAGTPAPARRGRWSIVLPVVLPERAQQRAARLPHLHPGTVLRRRDDLAGGGALLVLPKAGQRDLPAALLELGWGLLQLGVAVDELQHRRDLLGVLGQDAAGHPLLVVGLHVG